LAIYEKEIEALFSMWSDTHKSGITLSSVPHYHAYGFVFWLLWPLSIGIPVLAERIKYPEQLLEYLNKWKITLISSPAFLRRWAEIWQEQAPPKGTILQILSAGGELPKRTAEKIATKTGKPVHEIYGSTETGAVAFRHFPTQEWQLIDSISATIDSLEQRLTISSPYAVTTQGFMTSDKAELLSNKHFILKGRTGNIVKIEEKRLSTQEMVECCKKLPYFDEIHIIALQTQKKEMLGVVSTLSFEGTKALEELGKHAFVQKIKAHLHHYFEPVLIPRKWRFIDQLPRNEMGKVIYSDLLSLFEKSTYT
jgi:acyl-coenzyme A synthetase/AMP-(fatty) acid ligase